MRMTTILIYYPEHPDHITKEEMEEICLQMTDSLHHFFGYSNMAVAGIPFTAWAFINQRSLPVLVFTDEADEKEKIKIKERVEGVLLLALKVLEKRGWGNAIRVRVFSEDSP